MCHGKCVQVREQLLGAFPSFLLRQTAIQVSCLTNFEVILLPPPPISQWEYWDYRCMPPHPDFSKWVTEDEFRSIGLRSNRFYLLSHLAAPNVCILKGTKLP